MVIFRNNLILILLILQYYKKITCSVMLARSSCVLKVNFKRKRKINDIYKSPNFHKRSDYLSPEVIFGNTFILILPMFLKYKNITCIVMLTSAPQLPKLEGGCQKSGQCPNLSPFYLELPLADTDRQQ